MSQALNIKDMAAVVARLVEDKTHKVWTESEKIAAIDSAGQSLFVAAAQKNRGAYRDRISFTPADARAIGTAGNYSEFVLPEYVYKIEYIEDASTPLAPIPVEWCPLEERELRASAIFSGTPRSFQWTLGNELLGRFGLKGNMSAIQELRVWYIRRVAAQHYGVAVPIFTTTTGSSASGQKVLNVAATTGFASGMVVQVNQIQSYTIDVVGATTLTMTTNLLVVHGAGQPVVAMNAFQFDAAPGNGPSGTRAGSTKTRAGLYTDVKIEMLDTEELLRINGNTVSIAGVVPTITVTFDQPLTTWPISGTPIARSYAMIPQVGQEHHELLGLEAAELLLRDTSNAKQKQVLEQDAVPLRLAFESASTNRPQTKNRQVRMSDWL